MPNGKTNWSLAEGPDGPREKDLLVPDTYKDSWSTRKGPAFLGEKDHLVLNRKTSWSLTERSAGPQLKDRKVWYPDITSAFLGLNENIGNFMLYNIIGSIHFVHTRQNFPEIWNFLLPNIKNYYCKHENIFSQNQIFLKMNVKHS